MIASIPRARARAVRALPLLWLTACAGAVSAAEAPGSGAAPATPTPASTATLGATAILERTCLSQDFRPYGGTTRPWGDALEVAIDLELPATIAILACDQISASARLDDGETLEFPYRATGMRFQGFTMSSFVMKSDVAHVEPLDLTFALPARPSRVIASLSGTARLVVTDTSLVSHVMATPKLNVPIAIYGLGQETAAAPDGSFPPDMILTLQDDNKFTINYRSAGSCRLQGIALRDSANQPVPLPNFTSMSMRDAFISQTGTLVRQVASIDLTVYDTVRCGRVAFGFDAIPLAGPMDAAQRRRHATWTGLPVTGAFAAHVKAVDDPHAPVSGDPGNGGGGQGVVAGNGGVVHLQFGGAVAAPAAPAAPGPGPAAPVPAPAPPGPAAPGH